MLGSKKTLNKGFLRKEVWEGAFIIKVQNYVSKNVFHEQKTIPESVTVSEQIFWVRNKIKQNPV